MGVGQVKSLGDGVGKNSAEEIAPSKAEKQHRTRLIWVTEFHYDWNQGVSVGA